MCVCLVVIASPFRLFYSTCVEYCVVLCLLSQQPVVVVIITINVIDASVSLVCINATTTTHSVCVTKKWLRIIDIDRHHRSVSSLSFAHFDDLFDFACSCCRLSSLRRSSSCGCCYYLKRREEIEKRIDAKRKRRSGWCESFVNDGIVANQFAMRLYNTTFTYTILLLPFFWLFAVSLIIFLILALIDDNNSLLTALYMCSRLCNATITTTILWSLQFDCYSLPDVLTTSAVATTEWWLTIVLCVCVRQTEW